MFIDVLTHTPLWVFGLLLVLAYFGYLQSKTRVVSRRRVIMLPTVMLGLSLLGIWSAFGADAQAFAFWLLGILCVVLANRLLRQPRGVTYSDVTGLYQIRGSWVPLILMVSIFSCKYSVAVALAISPALRFTGSFAVVVSAVYGSFSGIFLARAIEIRRSAGRIYPKLQMARAFDSNPAKQGIE